jgi:hypothetical protein
MNESSEKSRFWEEKNCQFIVPAIIFFIWLLRIVDALNAVTGLEYTKKSKKLHRLGLDDVSDALWKAD